MSREKIMKRIAKKIIIYFMNKSNIICDLIFWVSYIIRKQNTVYLLESADKVINEFSRASSKKLRRRMVVYNMHLGTKMNEFLQFNFINLSKREQKTFLLDKEKDDLCIKYNGWEHFNILKDKAKTAEIFKEFFKRNFLKVSGKDDYLKFCEFCKYYNEFVVKPIRESGGCGVALVSIVKDNIEQIFNNLLSNYGEFLIEEKIKQCQNLSNWNPDSVNTVRVSTILYRGGVIIYKPFFRTGRKDSFTDNLSMSGVSANVDPNTGVLITDGVDKFGNTYICHPDSHIKYKGYQIPKWDELLDLAKKLANILPNGKYVGWDLALTDDSWVMVEGNWGKLRIPQMNDKKGLRAEFKKLMEESSEMNYVQ